MEEKTCKYNKYGFSKFKDLCRKEHLKEICQNHGACDNKSECNKRHPKTYKRFTTDRFCRFEKSCAYSHSEPSELNKNIIISEMQVKLA